MQKIKVVLVGDSGIGKSSMLITYSTNTFPIGYYAHSTIEDYQSDQIIDGKEYHVVLYDTNGQAGHDKERPFTYTGADIFLLCFSVMDPLSYQNVENPNKLVGLKARNISWYEELVNFAKQDRQGPNENPHFDGVPRCLLVGTKTDLRHNDKELARLAEMKCEPVTARQGEDLAFDLRGCVGYVECSALKREGLKNVFDAAFNNVIMKRKAWRDEKKCNRCVGRNSCTIM